MSLCHVCLCSGSAGEAGLLPRALVSVFTALGGQLYPRADLKPVLKQEVRRLSDTEVRIEEDRRHGLLREVCVNERVLSLIRCDVYMTVCQNAKVSALL